MISKSKQNWEIGQTVKVGFMTLTVLATKAIKDFLPDYYLLEGKNGSLYAFVPYNGISKITRREWDMI